MLTNNIDKQQLYQARNSYCMKTETKLLNAINTNKWILLRDLIAKEFVIHLPKEQILNAILQVSIEPYLLQDYSQKHSIKLYD